MCDGRCVGGCRCAVVGVRWYVGGGRWANGRWMVVGDKYVCGGHKESHRDENKAYGRAVMFNFIYLVRRSAWFLKIQKSVFSPF